MQLQPVYADDCVNNAVDASVLQADLDTLTK